MMLTVAPDYSCISTMQALLLGTFATRSSVSFWNTGEPTCWKNGLEAGPLLWLLLCSSLQRHRYPACCNIPFALPKSCAGMWHTSEWKGKPWTWCHLQCTSNSPSQRLYPGQGRSTLSAKRASWWWNRSHQHRSTTRTILYKLIPSQGTLICK